MVRLFLTMALCLSMAGCQCHPLRMEATAHVKPELPSVSSSGPVAPQTVAADHGVDCECEECAAMLPKIAVIDVDGLLVNADMTGLGSAGENPVALFRERLDSVACDPCVRAVVLRINSPGGGVTATDIMWHDLQQFRQKTELPVVACILDVGTGGAYYIATASDSIVAHPTSVTGGIGVILNVYNLSDALAQFNIVSTPVKAGENIDIGTPNTALTKERRKMLQTMADEFHRLFTHVVEDARPAADAGLKSNFDGRVFTASQALERKLIDEVGYLDNAVERAKQLACVQSAKVVMYHRCNDRPRSPYAITPNVPLQNSLIPLSLPGFDRSRMPTFLYLWQPEPTMEKMVGR
jgi:protease-4